jgi:hypothetical protein
MGETFPEPNDGSPPIPPAIGLREQDEARPGRLSADQLRLNGIRRLSLLPLDAVLVTASGHSQGRAATARLGQRPAAKAAAEWPRPASASGHGHG